MQPNALPWRVRDGGCFQCGAPMHRCELHHVREWHRDGGRTDIDNLVAVCTTNSSRPRISSCSETRPVDTKPYQETDHPPERGGRPQQRRHPLPTRTLHTTPAQRRASKRTRRAPRDTNGVRGLLNAWGQRDPAASREEWLFKQLGADGVWEQRRTRSLPVYPECNPYRLDRVGAGQGLH